MTQEILSQFEALLNKENNTRLTQLAWDWRVVKGTLEIECTDDYCIYCPDEVFILAKQLHCVSFIDIDEKGRVRICVF